MKSFMRGAALFAAASLLVASMGAGLAAAAPAAATPQSTATAKPKAAAASAKAAVATGTDAEQKTLNIDLKGNTVTIEADGFTVAGKPKEKWAGGYQVSDSVGKADAQKAGSLTVRALAKGKSLTLAKDTTLADLTLEQVKATAAGALRVDTLKLSGATLALSKKALNAKTVQGSGTLLVEGEATAADFTIGQLKGSLLLGEKQLLYMGREEGKAALRVAAVPKLKATLHKADGQLLAVGSATCQALDIQYSGLPVDMAVQASANGGATWTAAPSPYRASPPEGEKVETREILLRLVDACGNVLAAPQQKLSLPFNTIKPVLSLTGLPTGTAIRPFGFTASASFMGKACKVEAQIRYPAGGEPVPLPLEAGKAAGVPLNAASGAGAATLQLTATADNDAQTVKTYTVAVDGPAAAVAAQLEAFAQLEDTGKPGAYVLLQAAYDALPAASQALVQGDEAAKRLLANAQAWKDKADQAVSQVVLGIGNLSLSSKITEVFAVQAAYEALAEAQRAQVHNAATLSTLHGLAKQVQALFTKLNAVGEKPSVQALTAVRDGYAPLEAAKATGMAQSSATQEQKQKLSAVLEARAAIEALDAYGAIGHALAAGCKDYEAHRLAAYRLQQAYAANPYFKAAAQAERQAALTLAQTDWGLLVEAESYNLTDGAVTLPKLKEEIDLSAVAGKVKLSAQATLVQPGAASTQQLVGAWALGAVAEAGGKRVQLPLRPGGALTVEVEIAGVWEKPAVFQLDNGKATPLSGVTLRYDPWSTIFCFTAPKLGSYAVYGDALKYRVDFDAKGGGGTLPMLAEKGKGTGSVPVVARPGYAFGGWYMDTGLTQRFTAATPVTGNRTVYAKWTKVADAGEAESWESFWKDVDGRIRAAAPGRLIWVEAGNYTNMPTSVLTTLRGRSVALAIRWGQDYLHLEGERLPNVKGEWVAFDQLLRLFEQEVPEESFRPTPKPTLKPSKRPATPPPERTQRPEPTATPAATAIPTATVTPTGTPTATPAPVTLTPTPTLSPAVTPPETPGTPAPSPQVQSAAAQAGQAAAAAIAIGAFGILGVAGAVVLILYWRRKRF